MLFRLLQTRLEVAVQAFRRRDDKSMWA